MYHYSDNKLTTKINEIYVYVTRLVKFCETYSICSTGMGNQSFGKLSELHTVILPHLTLNFGSDIAIMQLATFH